MPAGRIVTPDGVVEGHLTFADGRIAGIRSAPVDADAPWLVPGFVDLHVHGGGGASYASDDPDEVRAAAAWHLQGGTTTTLASLVTAPQEVLVQQVATVASVVEAGSTVVGSHLEGPFLDPGHKGAHDPRLLLAPDADLAERIVAAGRGTVRMMTLAPELPGGLELVAALAAAGVLPAVGHTDATADVVRSAAAAGARVGTHLFNGMRGLHHREPGTPGGLLDSPDVVCELICDGVHLDGAVVRLAFASARGGVVLVTDAISAAGAPDGRYRLGSLDVDVVDGVARLVEGGSIAGSTLTTGEAFRRAVRDFSVALEDVVQAASTRPARVLGLTDRGAVEVGLRADVVELSPDLAVQQVFLAGVPVR
ncbi:N-acetylglucosamine-6-phosphate deacetylase [Motilibacter rhizosphaerae]|uniref:N-acetylglucosamine-6-phosphate deacetylase n=1 Tax=Motilibacter rhizosphaerae TaxID=598652 RepID=A0A4Q7NRV1_9ACTN|nr:N-acetylglucosamine-6-phosphate deacetylase [Motilibacter rhizosphaerae]RZS89807.1 N-acetylglucosamine-6-phosphate deacetylase [Motilibacter rhizosphaerae]